MPRRTLAIPADALQLRQLPSELVRLPVPALLRVRDAVEAALATDALTAADIAAVLDAAAHR